MKKSKKKLLVAIDQVQDYVDRNLEAFRSEIDDLRSDLTSFRRTKLEDINPPISHFRRSDDPEAKIRLLNKKMQHLEQLLNNAISGQMIKTDNPTPPPDPWGFAKDEEAQEAEAYNAAMKKTADFIEAEEKAKNALPD